MQRLFIYGTLAPGKANHHVVRDIPGHWQRATLKGKLINEGWGAEHGCPGIIPNDDGRDVLGFVFSSPELEAHWPRLDAFEGEGYRRQMVTVTLDNGETREAYVYALTM